MKLDFKPNFLIRHPVIQTILGSKQPASMTPSNETVELIPVPDGSGDKLAVLNGSKNQGSKLQILLVPGLGSSAKAPGLKRLTFRLEDAGFHVFRMNHRGVSDGAKHSKSIYHGGRSDDVAEVIRFIEETISPSSKVILISLSMGGNMALKALGEHRFQKVIKHISLSPVINLKESSQAMSHIHGGFYQKVFQKPIEAYCRKRHREFPELGPYQPTRPFTLAGFDREYTAIQGGFTDVDEYYKQSSAKEKMANTEIDTSIIFSLDDKIEPLKDYINSKKINLISTKYGGHLGFVRSFPIGAKSFWADDLILELIGKLDQES